MAEATIYSTRLGAISDTQFAAAADRAGVGRFLRAAPTTSGLFGQNVFITTTEGEFVLRGAPHWVDLGDSGPWKWEPNDRYQFMKEALFARLLHEKTDAPVPWPYLLVEDTEIFGWPYIIMVRMPGDCLDERSILKSLSPDQRHEVAQSLGDVLARQQRLEWSFAGDIDPNTYELTPYRGGYLAQTARQTLRFAENSRSSGTLTRGDDAWVERIIAAASNHREAGHAVYLHGDFKLGNLCVMERGGSWEVSGIFDLHTSHFGDGEADLSRLLCSYVDTDKSLAAVFLDSYRAGRPLREGFALRMPLDLINERLKIWEYFRRPDVDAAWLRGKTFQSWVQPYIDRFAELL